MTTKENSRLWAIASKAFQAGLMQPDEGTDEDASAAVHREIWELYSLESVKDLSRAQYRAYTNDLQARLDGGTAGVARAGYLVDAHDLQLFVTQRADELTRLPFTPHRSWLVAQGTNWDTVVELLDSWRLFRRVHKRLTEKQVEGLFKELLGHDMGVVMEAAEVWRAKYAGSKNERYFFGVCRGLLEEKAAAEEEQREQGRRGAGDRGSGNGDRGGGPVPNLQSPPPETFAEGDPGRAKEAIRATRAAKRVRRELGLPEVLLEKDCPCSEGMMSRLDEESLAVAVFPCVFCQEGLQAMVRAEIDGKLPTPDWYRKRVELGAYAEVQA